MPFRSIRFPRFYTVTPECVTRILRWRPTSTSATIRRIGDRLRRRGSRVGEQRRLGAEQEVPEQRRDGDRLALAHQERRGVGRPVYPSRRR